MGGGMGGMGGMGGGQGGGMGGYGGGSGGGGMDWGGFGKLVSGMQGAQQSTGGNASYGDFQNQCAPPLARENHMGGWLADSAYHQAQLPGSCTDNPLYPVTASTDRSCLLCCSMQQQGHGNPSGMGGVVSTHPDQ